ncbi:MAG: hypothetical protein HY830_19390 [Actinobacteria bacterium]|nr:hypothetical protein [Actinomycetota bacterium]
MTVTETGCAAGDDVCAWPAPEVGALLPAALGRDGVPAVHPDSARTATSPAPQILTLVRTVP